MNKPMRTILADDHTLVRAGIRALLEKLPDVQVLAEAGDGREVLKLARARAGFDLDGHWHGRPQWS